MEVPKNILAIVRKIANKHTSNIEVAVKEAESTIRKLPEFDTLVDMLVHNAITEMVYDARHQANKTIKRNAGQYGGPAKVIVGTSTSIKDAYDSIYNLRIAGTLLGLIRGDQLQSVAETERAIGNGHYVNAALVESLVGLVPADKTVQQSVKASKIKQLWTKLQKKYQNAA